MEAIQCTKCSSKNVQKLSLVHSGGVVNVNLNSTGTTSGIGVGVGTGGLGVGVGVGKTSTQTTGTQQSQLSKQFEPPTLLLPDCFLAMVALYFVGVVGLMLALALGFYVNSLLLMVLGLFFAVIAAFFAHKLVYQLLVPDWEVQKAKERYQYAKLEWDNSFLCQTCGGVFIFDIDSTSKPKAI